MNLGVYIKITTFRRLLQFALYFVFLQKIKYNSMQIISIELLNDNALSLLKELEALNLLRLVKTIEVPKPPKRKWSGSLSAETADKMLVYVEKSRQEWEERNI